MSAATVPLQGARVNGKATSAAQKPRPEGRGFAPREGPGGLGNLREGVVERGERADVVADQRSVGSDGHERNVVEPDGSSSAPFSAR